MKQLVYTPDAAEKLRSLNRTLLLQYGSQKAKDVVSKITSAIRGLVDNDQKGPSVENMFDVATDYRYIYVSKHYVFYRVEDKYIRIINMYHEKEDFMWSLFGIDTRTPESLDYWGE